MEDTMPSEVYMLRLEVQLRQAAIPATSDRRFVPFALAAQTRAPSSQATGESRA